MYYNMSTKILCPQKYLTLQHVPTLPISISTQYKQTGDSCMNNDHLLEAVSLIKTKNMKLIRLFPNRLTQVTLYWYW